jgi:hypothetical protein
MDNNQNPSLEKNFPVNYREDVVGKIFENISKGESFSFIGMEDNCKINVLRFLSSREDIQKKYLKNKAGNYLYVLTDINELMEPTVTGFYHLLGLSLIETLKSEKIDFSFLNNIFIDSPQILLKSLKEDFTKVVEKTGKTIVVIFNEFDVISQNLNLDLITRNLVALRNTARFNIIYIFTILHPIDLKYSFYKKTVWMTPFEGADALGVVERNAKRYKVDLNDKQKKEIVELTGGHAGMIKFIIQNLAGVDNSNLDRKIKQQENCGDICLQSERILAPLTDIEKSKLRNDQRDELLLNLGLQVKTNGKTRIFSPILERYLKRNRGCIPPFCFDKENNEIYLYGKSVTKELTLKEFSLMKLLIGSPNKIFKRDEIMEKIWECDEFPTDWAFDKLVSRLRKKLSGTYKGNYINIRKGVGISLN